MSIEDTKNPRSAIRGFFYAYNASTKARPVAYLLSTLEIYLWNMYHINIKGWKYNDI